MLGLLLGFDRLTLLHLLAYLPLRESDSGFGVEMFESESSTHRKPSPSTGLNSLVRNGCRVFHRAGSGFWLVSLCHMSFQLSFLCFSQFPTVPVQCMRRKWCFRSANFRHSLRSLCSSGVCSDPTHSILKPQMVPPSLSILVYWPTQNPHQNHSLRTGSNVIVFGTALHYCEQLITSYR